MFQRYVTAVDNEEKKPKLQFNSQNHGEAIKGIKGMKKSTCCDDSAAFEEKMNNYLINWQIGDITQAHTSVQSNYFSLKKKIQIKKWLKIKEFRLNNFNNLNPELK